MNFELRRFLVAGVFAAISLLSPLAFAQEGAHVHEDGTVHERAHGHAAVKPQFGAKAIRLFGSLPIQDGGRVKPISTMAGFKLLKFNGIRKVTTPLGEKLDPTEWLLHCLFFPEVAQDYEFFQIQNDEVLTAIGLSIEGKKKRDRYSFEQLRPGVEALMNKASEWAHIEAVDQTLVQRQLLSLARNLREFIDLTREFDFAFTEFSAANGPEVQRLLGGEKASLSVVLAKMQDLRALYLRKGREKLEEDPDRVAAGKIFGQLQVMAGVTQLGLIAPEVSLEQETEWSSVLDLIPIVLQDERPTEKSIELVGYMEKLVGQRADPASFEANLVKLHAGSVALSGALDRDEYRKIPIEQRFYKADFFYRALVMFLLSFLLCAVGWLKPSSKWVQRGVWLSLLGGTLLATLGITMRCIIRSRPPVSTLYETILFIAVVCVLVALLIEYINRQRLALAMATIFGAVGMWLSMKYELKEAATAGDTMPSLVAVLDTNFWLSTHVTTVTMGYSAGLLASLMAHVWVFGKLFGLKRGDTAFYKHITRMVYGVLCFGLLFSVVGTILGGIWANYSWGRFWGWDPKENGALLICLWELMILHLRMGGFIRDRGLCNLAIFGGMVVSFSWWGVNLLGIGLHSYGFTSGIGTALTVFYLVEVTIIAVSLIHWVIETSVERRLASLRAGEGDFSSGASQ